MEIPIDMNIFQSPLLQTVVSMDAMIPEDVIDEILFSKDSSAPKKDPFVISIIFFKEILIFYPKIFS